MAELFLLGSVMIAGLFISFGDKQMRLWGASLFAAMIALSLFRLAAITSAILHLLEASQ